MKSLETYLQSAKKSLFRFEYLQEYDVSEEKGYIEKYRKTGKLGTEEFMQEWWDFLEQKRRENVKIQRVRFVKKPLTEYLSWEMEVYKETIKPGEEIRLLSEDKLTSDLEKLGDFWIVDDSIALKMKYTKNGEYEGFELVKNIEPYLFAKKYLLENYTTLSSI